MFPGELTIRAELKLAAVAIRMEGGSFPWWLAARAEFEFCIVAIVMEGVCSRDGLLHVQRISYAVS